MSTERAYYEACARVHTLRAQAFQAEAARERLNPYRSPAANEAAAQHCELMSRQYLDLAAECVAEEIEVAA